MLFVWLFVSHCVDSEFSDFEFECDFWIFRLSCHLVEKTKRIELRKLHIFVVIYDVHLRLYDGAAKTYYELISNFIITNRWFRIFFRTNKHLQNYSRKQRKPGDFNRCILNIKFIAIGILLHAKKEWKEIEVLSLVVKVC